MREWPQYITAPNGKWIRIEDFEALLRCFTLVVYGLPGAKNLDYETVKQSILEIAESEQKREKNDQK
jgi:hypothetical protein